MILQIVLAIIVLILAYPAGRILRHYTQDEKKLYSRYFPYLAWIFLILAIVFSFFDVTIALTFVFMLLLIEFWKE